MRKYTTVEGFLAARKAHTPIMAINVFDPAATMETLQLALGPDEPETPIIVWDIVRGWQHRNDRGAEAIAEACQDIAATQNPVECLELAQNLPPNTILFMMNAQHHLKCDKARPDFIQALWNLRDQFTFDKRTVVLLACELQLPTELQQDVLVLNEELPTDEQYRKMIESLAERVSMKVKPDVMEHALVALRGIAAFPAEQAIAMSFTKKGLDVDRLWERKRQLINDTPGLSVWMGGQKFDDIGGLEQIKQRFRRIIAGKKPPKIVVWIDEIEKAMSGSDAGHGDTSGTSQDQLGVLLSEMQDKEYDGTLFVGVPGAAKSAFAKAVANEAGVITIKLDLGALKGQFVGQSEERIRRAMKIIEAVGGHGGAFFIATSNDIRVVKPELKRRFKKSIWFFDTPDKPEREKIWEIYLSKFPEVAKHDKPNADGWTGAEIESCVMTAWEEGITLKEAAESIIPVSISDRKGMERLRDEADGRYNSTVHPGAFKKNAADIAAWPVERHGRRLSL